MILENIDPIQNFDFSTPNTFVGDPNTKYKQSNYRKWGDLPGINMKRIYLTKKVINPRHVGSVFFL